MIRRAVIVACVLYAAPAAAQVAYVTNVTTYSASTTTLTMASVPAGTNGTIVVGISVRDTGTITASNVLFGGSATGVTTFQTKLTNSGVATTVFCIANVSGTANVTATISAAGVPVAGTALVFSGADTSTPCTAPQSTNTSGLTATATPAVSCASSGMVFDVIGHRDDTVTITSTQTQRSAQPSASQGSVQHKTSTAAGAASVTMGYTDLSNVGFQHIAGCLVAASGGGTSRPRKTLLHVGGA